MEADTRLELPRCNPESNAPGSGTSHAACKTVIIAAPSTTVGLGAIDLILVTKEPLKRHLRALFVDALRHGLIKQQSSSFIARGFDTLKTQHTQAALHDIV